MDLKSNSMGSNVQTNDKIKGANQFSGIAGIGVAFKKNNTNKNTSDEPKQTQKVV